MDIAANLWQEVVVVLVDVALSLGLEVGDGLVVPPQIHVAKAVVLAT